MGIPHRVVYLHFVCPPPDAASQSVRLSVDLACDDDMQAREQLDELYAVISRLGRLDRALILLWLEERPAGEIAAITGLSPGNVAVKLTRIRCKLRKMYNR